MNTLKQNNFKFNNYLDSLRSKKVDDYQEELNQKKIDKKEEIIKSDKPIKTPYIMKQYMYERKEHQKEFDKVNKKWMVVDDPETAYTSKNKFKNEVQGNLHTGANHKRPWSKLNTAIKSNRIKNYCNNLTNINECNKVITSYITNKYFEKEIPNKWIVYDEENGSIENIDNLYIIENINGELQIKEELEEFREKIQNEFNKQKNNGKYIPVLLEPVKVKKVKKQKKDKKDSDDNE